MNFFDDYFVFSTSEKKGIFIFVVILFLMTLFYMVMPYIFTAEKYDFTEFKKELESKKQLSENKKGAIQLFHFNPNTISRDSLLLLGLTNKQSFNIINFREKVGGFKSEKDFRKIYSIPDSLADILSPFLSFEKNFKTRKLRVEKTQDSLFNFDPNKASLSELQKLGLSIKQSQTVINFRKKGGKFFKKEDLKKIYSISDIDYSKLESYVKIDTIPQKKNKVKELVLLEKIELNLATKKQLIAIKGIGEKTADRIIKYRNKMGGFVELNQLNDVFGLDSIVKSNKASYFSIDKGEISQININTIQFKELLSHPYIDFNTTKKIINYREMHGDFNSVEEILENNLIKAEQYRKIVHYLTLQ